MRARNPNFCLRRLLDGWYVLLISQIAKSTRPSEVTSLMMRGRQEGKKRGAAGKSIDAVEYPIDNLVFMQVRASLSMGGAGIDSALKYER